MIKRIDVALLAIAALSFSTFISVTPIARADDDPHAEYHPGGLPTKKDTPMKEAERERKTKYEDLEMNKWPPDLWPRDKDDKKDDPK